MHLSYAQIKKRRRGSVSLDDAFEAVAPKIRDAAQQVAAQLESLGVRYALAGGLAVGAHGYARATTDVDFFVGDEAFERHGQLVTFRPGIPIQVGGVTIDYLSPAGLASFMEEALDRPVRSGGLPIVPLEALIAMKLIAGRRRDLSDVVELLKRVANEEPIRSYLRTHAEDLLPEFESLLREAGQE